MYSTAMQKYVQDVLEKFDFSLEISKDDNVIPSLDFLTAGEGRRANYCFKKNALVHLVHGTTLRR